MEGERIRRALSRIEAASGRIERAASRGGGGDAELERLYLNLRSEADAALGELDRLIGSLEE